LCAAITQTLARIEPAMGDTVSLLLQAHTLPPIQSILTRLLDNVGRYLAAHTQQRIALIVDNYQRMRTPDIHTACQFLLDRLPDRFQVIIASQTPFSFAVQRWRGRGVLTELVRDDLRLTPEEGSAWFEHNVAVRLTEAERRSLVIRTEGWAAGLNLIGLALKKRADVHRFVATFDGHHPYLQTYFVEEILGKQKPAWQDFLLQTSILRNLNGALCDEVTGHAHSADVLQSLHRHNQFVMLVDEKLGWYQYHDLFAQALQRQLAERQPALVEDLHRRAAAWYREQGLYGEALQHLLHVEAWPDITRLIDQAIVDEIGRGSDHRVLTWLQRLPDEFILRHKTVLVSYARLGLRSLSHGHITDMLQRLLSTSHQTSEVWETSEVFTRTQRSTADDRTFLTRLYEWARTNGVTPVPRPSEPTSPEIERLWYLLDQIDEGKRALQSGQTAAGEKLFSRVMATAKLHHLTFVTMMAGALHATVLTRLGQPRRGETLARDALQWAIDHVDRLPPSASVPLVALSRICYARNELAQARQYLNHAAVIDPHPTSLSMVLVNNGLLAYIESAEGNHLAAEAALHVTQELEPYLSGVFGINDLKIHHARIYLRLGDVEAAESALRLAGPTPTSPHHSDNLTLNCAWAELFLARRQYVEAEIVLKQPTSTQIDLFIPITLLPHLLLAQAFWGQRMVNRALREMVSALRLAEPEAMVRPFLDCGAPLIPLLLALQTSERLNHNQQQFVALLLDSLHRSHPQVSLPAPAEVASLVLATEISPREEETLRLLAQGLDNKAIAAYLIVSDSTVRTHLRHIYSKLGVTSRIQAVKRAQELQIV
jgi:LuxR family maltose regulon positive regulatory protein